jgi:hypothetical protein
MCRMNDVLERSVLDQVQVKSRYLLVSWRRSQCPVCRASVCRMNDALERSGLDLFQVKSRFLWVNFSALSVQCAERPYLDERRTGRKRFRPVPGKVPVIFGEFATLSVCSVQSALM